jgi:hypothetical protein
VRDSNEASWTQVLDVSEKGNNLGNFMQFGIY